MGFLTWRDLLMAFLTLKVILTMLLILFLTLLELLMMSMREILKVLLNVFLMALELNLMNCHWKVFLFYLQFDLLFYLR
jgi:hypothetical protein